MKSTNQNSDALLKRARESNEFIEEFKSAFLSATVVRIKNPKGDVVWCCADGEWRGPEFQDYEVDQDMNVYADSAGIGNN